jgi:16S rRNA (guanine966-N2)-methyltransferase
MRITGGEYGGRNLTSPTGSDIRPTSDRLRLAIFNMLDARLDMDGAVSADMFCGTGALGIETLSRGASFCYFWDKDRRSVALSQQNITDLKINADHYQIQCGSALFIGAHPDAKPKIDVVFIDPPYRKDLVNPCVRALIDGDWLSEDAWLVIESERGAQSDLAGNDKIEEKRLKTNKGTDLGLYQFTAL